MNILNSLSIFILAGLCEIGGSYLIWLWLKQAKPAWYGLLGGVILASYGIIATFKTQSFARVYATYGGIFIVMSFLFLMKFDHYIPDKYDVIGSLIALMGVCIIYYKPRCENNYSSYSNKKS